MNYINPYRIYATCSKCGFKKLCRQATRHVICKACDIKNLQEKKS